MSAFFGCFFVFSSSVSFFVVYLVLGDVIFVLSCLKSSNSKKKKKKLKKKLKKTKKAERKARVSNGAPERQHALLQRRLLAVVATGRFSVLRKETTKEEEGKEEENDVEEEKK
jgi:hypothetical protein